LAPLNGVRVSTHQALEPLARRLFTVLTDGCPYPLRYNVRNGFRLRDQATGKRVPSSYTKEWLPARDVGADGRELDRIANPYVLLQHLEGRHDVAIQAPSWSSLIVLDIDRKLSSDFASEEDRLEATIAANARRDAVLADVWRAYQFSAERQPVVLLTPGGGYHVYLPLDRPWPLAYARQWHEHHLDQHGLGLRPGVLELYPSGVPLRAPCGRGTLLLVPQAPDDPDALQLEPAHVLRRRGAPVRDVVGYVHGFLDRLAAARRPLEEWLRDTPERPAWDPTWGPFGHREKNGDGTDREGALYPHKVEVQRAGGPGPLSLSGPAVFSPNGTARADARSAKGYLRFGRAFREKVTALSLYGISAAAERHDAALKMTWYWHVVRGAGKAETLHELEDWLRSRPHAVKPGREQRWIRKTLVESRHYIDRLLRRGRRAVGTGVARPGIARIGLEPADLELVRVALPAEFREECVALLTYLATFADGAGRVPHAVDLPKRVVEALCGQRRILDEDGRKRRAAVLAIAELERLGLVALHTDYSTGRHGRRYTVWYCFGSGALPERDAELGGLVVGAREVEEGELVAVIEAPGEPPVGKLRWLRRGLADAVNAWWRRMYTRRAFTPAEFFEAGERRVLPGPFRDRRAPSRPKHAGVMRAPPPPVSPVEPPPHAWPCVCANCYGARAAVALQLAPEPLEGEGRALGLVHGRACLCAFCCERLLAGLGVRKIE
jgi:hypothetical protein